ncbi:MAG TPA: hypothetical protein VFS08_20730 [Gemmatimonadaceae bacterium]|nr:hypothetical protein [Gemmatimonadaceae bacterium]
MIDFTRLLGALDDATVESDRGGVAATVHGGRRPTRDSEVGRARPGEAGA